VGVEHGLDELEDGALIGRGELFDALEPLEQPGGARGEAAFGRKLAAAVTSLYDAESGLS
jgi:hypothetical protein